MQKANHVFEALHKLASLAKRWAGKPEKPRWVKLMIARSRQTLVVCQSCHLDIHHGRLIR